MPFKEYLYTLNAPDMRKRAIRVMSVLWTEERREKLLVEADPKRPDLEIVTEGEYQKIIRNFFNTALNWQYSEMWFKIIITPFNQ